MSRPVRSKRPLTLAREFQNSVKAGPRVWLITAVAFLCLVGLPLLSKLASFLAMALVGVGLLFVAPVILRAVVAGLVEHFKRTVVFRVFTDPVAGGSAPPPIKQAGEALGGPSVGRGEIREADVIEVEAVAEEKKSPVF